MDEPTARWGRLAAKGISRLRNAVTRTGTSMAAYAHAMDQISADFALYRQDLRQRLVDILDARVKEHDAQKPTTTD